MNPLKTLHELVRAVATSTRDGSERAMKREESAVKKVAQLVLGRKPNNQEVEKVMADYWKE